MVITLAGHEDWVVSVSFSPDGSRIVSGSRDKTVRIWDAATGVLLITLAGHEDVVESVSFSPDGYCVVSGSRDKNMCIWVVAKGSDESVL